MTRAVASVRTLGSGLGGGRPRVYLQSPAARSSSSLPGQALTGPVCSPARAGKLPPPASLSRSDPTSPRGRGARLRAGETTPAAPHPAGRPRSPLKPPRLLPPRPGRGRARGGAGAAVMCPRGGPPRSLSPVPQLRPNFLYIRSGHRPGYSGVLPSGNLHFPSTLFQSRKSLL